jgi:HD-like signal output (HDOD) protein
MTTCDIETARTRAISAQLDDGRQRGSLRQIVIPPCPRLLTRLQQALANKNVDHAEISRIAATDVAMSATLIRAANSPLYSAGQPAQSLGQALTLLGLNRAAAVMTGFLAKRAIRVDSPHLKRFWERAAKRARAMALVARQLPGMSPDIAYTYGLFSHVGLPVLLQCTKGYGGTLVEAAARRDRSFIATENANHRTDHAVVGALVARVWGLAPAVMAAIRLHHDLDALNDDTLEAEVRTLVATGLVADHLMHHDECIKDDAEWHTDAPRAMAWLQIGPDDVEQWEDQCEGALSEG